MRGARRRWLRTVVVYQVGYIILFSVFFLILQWSGVDLALSKTVKLFFFSELLLMVALAIDYKKMLRR
ncbi:hypothetical protein FHR67_003288 [Xanthomonas arboricola]|nr:hypothetical protein [Xanthomonas campestris]